MASSREQLEAAIARFSGELLEIIRAAVAEAIVETQPERPSRGRARRAGGAPRRRRGAGGAEGGDLEARILRSLEASEQALSTNELQRRLRAEPGPLRYAIKKLKSAGSLVQEGERRGARYRKA